MSVMTSRITGKCTVFSTAFQGNDIENIKELNFYQHIFHGNIEENSEAALNCPVWRQTTADW